MTKSYKMTLSVLCVAALMGCSRLTGGLSSMLGDDEPYEYRFGPNTTYYYERVAQVRNGDKQEAVGDGHYLTVAPKGIFESDETGNTKGFGFMKKESSQNGRTSYSGKSYLGNDVEYIFNSDYSRLNVRTADGTVYVYQAAALSSDNSRQRHYTTPEDNFAADIPAYDNPGASSSSSSSSSSSTRRKGKSTYECPICHGQKRIVEERSLAVSHYGVPDVVYVNCSECGKRYDKHGTIHHHVICKYCRGRGYQEVD